ncbi:hypothetical protein [Aquibacillus albus]|uniref:Spore coat protein n=1 Tax=Aquibacillus albus TaxID=1168171 RepID=A0ABS2N0C5_9BACI|nr:hypothetical protein [Aquibacillus albus]MBM7571555.1 hypothetical protein [Aquibacillus albus]
MSEKKKVIYVKDLVIKAENVHIEPPRPRPRPVDPFFGPRRAEVEEEAVEEKVEEEVEERDDDDDHDDDQKDDERRPFSWI